MPKGFASARYHITDSAYGEESGNESFQPRFEPLEESVLFTTNPAAFAGEEAAARAYLHERLRGDPSSQIQALAITTEDATLPDFRLRRIRPQPLTDSQVVFFEQYHRGIPVYGSLAYVEMNRDRAFVACDAAAVVPAAVLDPISPHPDLSADQAIQRVAEFAQTAYEDGSISATPTLAYFYESSDEAWHLVYIVSSVPYTPAAPKESEQAHAAESWSAPHTTSGRYTFYVDAHTGEVLSFHSERRGVNPPRLPSICQGMDDNDQLHEFYGYNTGDGFVLQDPTRNIRTVDLSFQYHCLVYDTSAPQPLRYPSGDWSRSNPAAISAHVNAAIVYDFYNAVLHHTSIDDKGSEIVSFVNCAGNQNPEGTPVEWNYAQWSRQCMWYGQVKDGNGKLRSMARHLDIVAHELTHGVVDYASQLGHFDEAGALAESFSDIFAIIIKNWHRDEARTAAVDSIISVIRHLFQEEQTADVQGWDWEIGAGLSAKGKPLRDISNPGRTQNADHVRKFVTSGDPDDAIYANCTIHSLAAYHLLTATDTKERAILSPRQVAILYYYALWRLSAQATFADVLTQMLEVAKTLFADIEQRRQALDTIAYAYSKVGIYPPW